MKIKSILSTAMLLTAGAVFAGEFTLQNNGLQNKISYNGKEFIEKITSKVLAKGEFAPDAKQSFENNISNIWSENPASLFRQEVSVTADKKSVEINFLAFNDAYNRHQGKSIEIVLPYSWFEGAEFEGLHTNGRAYQVRKGKLTAATPNGSIERRLFRFFNQRKKGNTLSRFDKSLVSMPSYTIVFPKRRF